MGRKGAPPVAESSDRSGCAGTCLCTNEVQGKGLVPTRKSVLLAVGPCRHCLHRVRIATGLTALAMTDVVDGLHLGFDFPCHCEEAKPTWQSVPPWGHCEGRRPVAISEKHRPAEMFCESLP